VLYNDLSTECQVDRGEHVRAIGWLSEGHRFPTGRVPAEFLTALRSHVHSAWQPVVAMGPHFCEFCAKASTPEKRVGGARNVWIPASFVVFVAPELVVHYVEAHNYRPPEEFISAVLLCPQQDSPEFHALLARFQCWWRNAGTGNK
jgi:hypothetical protein